MSASCLPFGQTIVAPPRGVTEQERRMIAAAFYEYDSGHKGYLNREDVKVATVSLFGYKPSKFEVDQVFRNATEVNGEHVLELDPFVKVMSSKMVAQDKDEEIRQVFLAFDTHCRGFLTLDDLLRACSLVAPHIPRHRMEAAFREVDSDRDSRVSYRDFEYMMKYSLDDRM
ncbi:EF-hand calcium-binding domain-containing protein 11-like [Branchiostoma floridae x Branchiostoma japonicum]